MKIRRYIYIICFGTIFSCNKDYKDEFYKDGELKFRTYSKSEDSIISYNKDGTLMWIKKFFSNDSLYMWDYENGKLKKDGVYYKNEALGKWNFYKNDYKHIVREFVWVDSKHHLNQVWYFNKKGDTVKEKGNYYKLSYRETINVGDTETIRFYLEKPLLDSLKTEMSVVYDFDFYNNRTKKTQKDKGTILGLNNEVLYESKFKDKGVLNFKGYIIDKSYFKDSLKGTLSGKLYFNGKIIVE